MADRTCPRCGAVAAQRLKFCRECGGRLDEAGDSPPPQPASSGDETLASSLPGSRSAPPSPAPPPPADDDGEEEPPEDPGDRTLISGLPRPALDPSVPLKGTGTATFVGGLPGALTLMRGRRFSLSSSSINSRWRTIVVVSNALKPIRFASISSALPMIFSAGWSTPMSVTSNPEALSIVPTRVLPIS